MHVQVSLAHLSQSTSTENPLYTLANGKTVSLSVLAECSLTAIL